MALLSRFAAFGEPQGGAMAAQGPQKVGPVHAAPCFPEGGGPLEDYKNPIRTALGITPRLNVPRARWRIGKVVRGKVNR